MEKLNKKLQEQFDKMCAAGKLFRSEITGARIWELYLYSFVSGDDPVFRDPESSTHNCNTCKSFIRRYGNIVAIDNNGNIMSLFDINVDDEYSKPMSVLSNRIKSVGISGLFVETYDMLNSLPYESCKKTNTVFQLGLAKNHKRYTKEEAEKYGVVKPNEIRTFHHFNLQLPKKFVDFSGESTESIMGAARDNYAVFKRGMEELPLDTLELVKDLINQGSLFNSDTYKKSLVSFIKMKKEYNKATKKDNFCWFNAVDYPYAKFKNTLIGVLCTELAEGEELNKACQSWNKRIDPVNYMKAKAPITKRQIQDAEKFVVENGYSESFTRRFATIDDIKVTEIKHINSGNGAIKEVSLFDKVKATKSRHKRNEFKDIEEISIDKFITDVLPSCTSVSAYLENKHENNLVTLTTASNENSKQIFKWNNNYSWTYNGNLAGKSMIKENVAKVGGNINAILRASLQWNDEDTKGIVDFDLHSCGKNHIYYSNSGHTHSCGGHLDVDMINPQSIGIENITWKNKIADGEYCIEVKNFNGRSNTGFKVEIEFDGITYNYHLKGNAQGVTKVAVITVKNGNISIKHLLPETSSNKEMYNLETNNFHKVNLVCLSPNHWDTNSVGHKHYFFMLDNCKTSDTIRSFHNENLNEELRKHRKVMEVLANNTMIEPSDKQLSGLGFNATVRDTLIVKCEGNFKRTLKIKF